MSNFDMSEKGCDIGLALGHLAETPDKYVMMTRKGWHNGENEPHLCMAEDGKVVMRRKLAYLNDVPYVPTREDITADDWIIYGPRNGWRLFRESRTEVTSENGAGSDG